ncbi:MAG: hypothetical protein FWF46_04570 [Oscillospiraceae bacterium]|nr:hypothetical protein [Oscillospiraceae bacterium]
MGNVKRSNGRGDTGLITSKGFTIVEHVPGKRIIFKDPDTGNCFVAKLGINSVEPISWYGESLKDWHDPDTPEIGRKRDFVRKYGMIIVPQFCLSLTYKKNDGLKSVRGRNPFTNRDWYDAKALFSKMRLPEGVSISMIAGFEVDQSLQHIIDTGEATKEDIVSNSKIFGGYDADEVYVAGRKGTPCIDGVYNQTGLVRFWTEQMYKNSCRVLRGGSCAACSDSKAAAHIGSRNPFNCSVFWSSTGTLCW